MSNSRRSARRSAGFYGVAVYRPKNETNVGTLWRSAFLYGAAFLATIGPRYHKQASDTPNTANHVPLYNYPTFEDFLEHLPHSTPIVGIELADDAFSLHTYAHPQRAVYLLGAEDDGLPSRILERCHQKVAIPTLREWSMNVASAGSIVQYDRYAKALANRQLSAG